MSDQTTEIVIIDGVRYDLDKKAAIKAGVLCQKAQLITDVNIGDVFTDTKCSNVIICLCNYSGQRGGKGWYIAGVNGLQAYSNLAAGVTKAELINYLNERGTKVFKMNLNSWVKEKFNELGEKSV